MLGRSGALRSDQLDAERVGELACDFVLQGEQITRGTLDAVSPEMRVGLGIDQFGR